MTMSPNFRDYLVDQLEPFGPVAAKRMFGGGKKKKKNKKKAGAAQ
jgi:TfoX/Sxy family transcriptional regulator of competence genes|tara:strand:- start:350 stop:484 length:135 start_codon:yes stop_codon:yes gene_type:complete